MTVKEAIDVLERSCDFHYEETDKCYGCLFENSGWCGDDFHERLLTLLKEQEARVMTLGEIFTAQKTDIWYEIRNEETIHPLMLVETENSIKNQCAYFYPSIVAPIKGYGKAWRCWTARPTDEQRKSVKWND